MSDIGIHNPRGLQIDAMRTIERTNERTNQRASERTNKCSKLDCAEGRKRSGVSR